MPHPAERRLEAVARIIDWLRTGALKNALDHLQLQMADGWSAGGLEPNRGSGINRPTENAALTGLTPSQTYGDIETLVNDLGDQLRKLVTLVQSIEDPGVDTELDWRRHRCTGGEGEWADPTCDRLAVRSVESENPDARMPVCDRCRQRFYRWKRAQQRQKVA